MNVVTRCQILRLKCTKFDFGWGSAPDPLAGFKGPTSKGREGREWEGKGWEEEGKGRGRGGTYSKVLGGGGIDAPVLHYHAHAQQRNTLCLELLL